MLRPALVSLALLVASTAPATLTIQINYSGDPQFQPFFASAATAWQNLLVGYQGGDSQNVVIGANVAPIDGVGMVLGSAGPTFGRTSLAGFVITTQGVMNFDDADAANLVTNGLFDDVVLHEMAHVLGFGTLWTFNNVYNNGSGEFTGANATAFWQSEFGQTGTPDVELGGGPGTANGHWNEVDGGAGLTGITSSDGDLRNELMTGWLNGASFISDMTIASFIDIGFVGSLAAIPEASSCLAMGLVFAGLAAKR